MSPSPRESYQDSLLIWDSRSKLVVALTHVVALDALAGAVRDPVPVTRGQRVGTLAPANPVAKPAYEAEARHAHVRVFDGRAQRALDALPFLATYTDTVAPLIHEVYVLDECGNRHSGLIDGPMEIIVRMSDRGDHDVHDFGVSRIGYVLTDQDGIDIAVESACDLRDPMSQGSQEPSVPALMDVQSIEPPDHYFGDGWWYAYRGLSYGYSLGSFTTGPERLCEVRWPWDVYFELPPGTTSLDVVVWAYDSHGNRATHVAKLLAEPAGAGAPDPAP